MGYDQLLRDIFDKPLIRKPALGSMPAYLDSDEPIFLSTAKEQSVLKEKNAESFSFKDWVERYFEKLIASLDQFKISFRAGNTKDLVDLIVKSIDSMQVVNNDFINFLETISANEECKGEQFIDFFEKLLQYYEDNNINLATSNSLSYLVNDNYRFFNYELFLSFTTIMLKHQRFDIIRDVVAADFCILSNRIGREIIPLVYVEFQKYNYTLDYFKKNLTNSNLISEAATLLKSKVDGKLFEGMVEADILLYYLSLVYVKTDEVYDKWYPGLSIYNSNFTILPKLASSRYFEKAKILFGVDDKEGLITLIRGLKDNLQRDGYRHIPSVQQGLGIDKICSFR